MAGVRILKNFAEFQTAQDAYNAAESGDVIQFLNGLLVGPPFFALRDIDITFKGGYELIQSGDQGYTYSDVNQGVTVMQGRVVLKSGKIIMENIKLK
jgi:hypothetical protein